MKHLCLVTAFMCSEFSVIDYNAQRCKYTSSSECKHEYARVSLNAAAYQRHFSVSTQYQSTGIFDNTTTLKQRDKNSYASLIRLTILPKKKLEVVCPPVAFFSSLSASLFFDNPMQTLCFVVCDSFLRHKLNLNNSTRLQDQTTLPFPF